jgi:cytoskeletal protein CcmA (bactofilin family)
MESGQTEEGFRVSRGPATAARNGAGDAAGEENLMSVIGADILITGNIEAQVDLHIEGKVVGDVRCATLILGERSTVTGSVYAERVRVSGMVEGAIETTDLAIEATARVQGDVTYSRLRIANGGVIHGSMIHKPLADEAPDTARLKLVEAAPEIQAPAPTPAPPKVHHIE